MPTSCFSLWAVVPIVAGPLQVLLALAPGILLLLFTSLMACFKPRVLWGALRIAWKLKLSLAICLAVLVGAFYLARGLMSQNPTTTAAETGKDWPTYAGSMARTGVAPGSLAPTRGGLNWSWNRNGHSVLSTAAVAGNRAYFTTAMVDVVGDGRGDVVAVDIDSGQTAWKVTPPGFRAAVSSPVIAGDYLLCGEGMHKVKDARIFCLDLRPGREGGLVWSHRTKSHVESTPLVHRDRVYVSAGDDGVYCLALTGDGKGSSRVLWHLEGKDYPDAELTPAIYETDGKTYLYFGLGVGGNALCAVDAETGEFIRRVETPYPVFGAPSIANGKLYVGMGHGDVVRTAEELGLAPGGAVWAIDLKRMNDPQAADPVDWKFPTDRLILSAVAVRDDLLYFGCRDQHLYCLNLDGSEAAAWSARSAILATPAVAEEYVYVVANSGALYALDRKTLKPVWEARVGDPGVYLSSPTVARGQVLVGAEVGGLLSFGKADPDHQHIRLWPGPLAGPGACGNPEGEPVPGYGAFAWQYPVTAQGENADTAVAAPPAAMGDYLFIPQASPNASGLARLSIAEPSEETPPAAWGELKNGLFPTANPVKQSPAISGELVLLVDGSAGDGGRYLYAVDFSSGEEQWKTNVATYATGVFCVTAEEVFVQDSPDYLTCRQLHERGRKRWTKSVGRLEQPVAVTPTMIVAAIANPPSLVVLDRVSGAVLAKTSLAEPPVAMPVVIDDVVYLSGAKSLEARRLSDPELKPLWSTATDGTGEITFFEGDLIAINGAGELLLVGMETGKVFLRKGGFLPRATPLLCRNEMLAPGAESLLWMSLLNPDEAASPWADTSWLGLPAGPCILHRGAVYQPRRGWGLAHWKAEQ